MTITQRINEKKEKRVKLIHDAREMVEAAEKEGRALDGEARQKWETMLADAEAIEKDVELLERQDKAERSILEASEPIHPEAKATKPDAEKLREQRNAAWRSYLAFGMDALEPEQRKILRDMSQGTDTAGGYLNPTEDFRAMLIKAMDAQVFMRGLSTMFTITMGDTLGAPSITADPSAASWTAEAGSISADSTLAIGKRQLVPNQLTKLIKISQKLLRVQGGVNADALVVDRISYLLAYALENGYLNGSGSSQPLGVFTASANGISTSRDYSTSNTATTIEADNLIGQKYNIKAQYWPGLQWIFGRAATGMIAKLKDGDGQYLWQPSYQAGQPDRLLGFPVNISELAPATFTTGLYVGILGNFKAGYWIADLIQMEFQRLVELYAANSQVGIIGRVWSDGAPVLEEAFSRVKLA